MLLEHACCLRRCYVLEKKYWLLMQELKLFCQLRCARLHMPSRQFQGLPPRTSSLTGSMQGGNPFTVSAPPSSIGFNTTHPDHNTVHISGVPCNVDSVSSHRLTCIPGAVSGRVLAEYWDLTQGNFAIPDIKTFTNPGG